MKGENKLAGCIKKQVLHFLFTIYLCFQKVRIYAYGVELNPKLVERLSNDFPEAIFVQHNLDNESLKIQETFDTVLMLAVVEHVWNQKLFFGKVIRHIKKDGKIIITTLTLWLFAQSAADDHIVIYNKKRFRILAEEFNLRIIVYKRFQIFCNQFVVLTKQ